MVSTDHEVQGSGCKFGQRRIARKSITCVTRIFTSESVLARSEEKWEQFV